MLFAVPLFALGHRHPTCIGGVTPGDDDDIEAQPPTFVDAYELSWTTFSTVGYGLVFSGISATEPDVHKCTGITILVTFEAFVGVLFASMCGAILFAKVSRTQSYAQVIYSDPIAIRYGSGVAIEQDLEGDDDHSVEDANMRIPCPVLEFRLNNRMHSIVGGEIIDATLNVVASIDANQAFPSTVKRDGVRRRRGRKGKRRTGRTSARRNSLKTGTVERIPIARSTVEMNSSGGALVGLHQDDAVALQSYVEDPTGHLVPRRIFSKLEIESPEHPFFKRVWFVRHKLDQHSPLLRTRVREMIKQNGGYWPFELNSHKGVRAAVHFDQILVSLTGTSNADANSVYSQKVYDFVDVNVGYRFVNQLYRDPADGCLLVDSRLINDVAEQAGGGGEPLVVEDESNQILRDMLVL